VREPIEGTFDTDKRAPNTGGATLFLCTSASFTILLFKLTDVKANDDGAAAVMISLEEEEKGAAAAAEWPKGALMLLPLLTRSPAFTVAAAFMLVRD
jgi:hypothetical protein